MSLLRWLWRRYVYLRLKFAFYSFNVLLRLAIRLGGLPSPSRKTVKYFTIPGVDGKGRLRIYLHAPPAASMLTPDGNPRPIPVHINTHGGGFGLDLHGTDTRFLELVAKNVGCYVVDADYRMTPDHPWPAAYNDVCHVLEWVRSNELGIFDVERITMGGFSAGANLALAVTGNCQPGIVKGVIAFYPPVDFSVPYPQKPEPPRTKIEKAKGMVVPINDWDQVMHALLLDQPEPWSQKLLKDPRLSPCFADPQNFPAGGRTMILGVEYDYLGPEAMTMVQMLEEAGREPVGMWGKGLGHGGDQMCPDGGEDAKMRDKIWETAMEVLRKAQGSSPAAKM